MEPLTLLATVMGTAISTALKPEAFVGSAIGGIIGNRVDAGFVKGLIWWIKGQAPKDQQELQRAIGRSMIFAQQSIVKDCLRSAGLSQADRRWLKDRQEELRMQLVEVENLPLEPIALSASEAIDAVDLGKLLLPQDADKSELLELRGQLVRVAELPGAPVVYLELVRSSFFERVCGCFGAEVRDRSDLRDLLELRLLGQIGERMLTIDDLTGALLLPLQAIDQRLANLQAIAEIEDQRLANLQADITEIKEQLRPSMPLSLPSGATLPPNPFVPLSGRIDDPSQFFAQEKLIGDIFETLDFGSSVALIGDRGMGKSSILKEIAHVSPHQLNRQAVYIDWNWIINEEDLWQMVCEKIRVRNVMELKRKIQSQKVLLLLDHVEKMEIQTFGEEIRTQLRAFSEGNQAKVVIASCISLDVLFPDGIHGSISPFHGLCEEHRILKWSDEMVSSYVQERLKLTPVRFTDREMQQIIRISDGIPQKLVKQCNQLYREYRDNYENR